MKKNKHMWWQKGNVIIRANKDKMRENLKKTQMMMMIAKGKGMMWVKIRKELM